MQTAIRKKNQYELRKERTQRRNLAICEFINEKHNIELLRIDRVITDAAKQWGLSELTIERIMKYTRV